MSKAFARILQSRGACEIEVLTSDDARIIVATARVADLLGVDSDFDTAGNGHIQWVLQFHHFAPVDGHLDPDDFPMSAALRA